MTEKRRHRHRRSPYQPSLIVDGTQTTAHPCLPLTALPYLSTERHANSHDYNVNHSPLRG